MPLAAAAARARTAFVRVVCRAATGLQNGREKRCKDASGKVVVVTGSLSLALCVALWETGPRGLELKNVAGVLRREQ